MNADLEPLLRRYETGQISRRSLLAALAAVCIPLPTDAKGPPKLAAARQLNHVTCFVRDVDESRQFYQDFFGMSVLTHQNPGVNLRIGGGFIGLYPAGDEEPRVDHLCVGIGNFDADRVLAKLSANGVDASINLRGNTKELYFTDPSGLPVQIQDVSYRGGVGPLGNRDPGK